MVSAESLLNTKMTHHRSSPQFSRKIVSLVVLVVISAFVLFYAPMRAMLTQALYTVAPGVWNIGGTASDAWGSFTTNFRIKRSLVYENGTLRAEIDRMQAQVLDRNLLEEKVMKLEEALGRAGSDNRVVASVLVGPGRSPYDTLVIDAGKKDGVEEGFLVAASEHTVNGKVVDDVVVYAGAGAIGTIAEVSDSSAKVKLYSSSGQEHLVLVGANAIPATARGRGMGNFEAKLPQGSTVSLGDTVLFPDDNLILGTVQLVEEEPSLPFITVFFRTPFNIADIRSVEVLTGSH